MTEFKTQEFPKENRHCLQFETDNRDYFLRVQTAAEECIDHKSLTNYERIKAMTVEEMAEMLCETLEFEIEYDVVLQWLESEVEE